MSVSHLWMVTREMEDAAFVAYLDAMHTFREAELSIGDNARIRKACRNIVAAALAAQILPTTGAAHE